MEIESATNQQSHIFSRLCVCLKALPCNAKSKIVNFINNIKKIAQDDPRRMTHSAKVGLALTLVSLLYYSTPLYSGFGVAAIWAVLTVVVVFEFTVGATLYKVINRGIATSTAAFLGVGAQRCASLFEEEARPFIIGIFVFLIAAGSTFSRFFPRVKARYDYGALIFILTFSMVSISGYRVEKILELAHQRVSTVLLGGATCIIVSLFVCPVWAGEDLHKLIASNVEKLAYYFEGFEAEYFQYEDGEDTSVPKNEKSLLQGYKTVLNSKATEESLANFARWEPGHGRFRFKHPWKQYLKIGTLSRECAYKIESLHSIINSDLQASEEFKIKVQEPFRNISSESRKALKMLSSSIKTMTVPSAATIHIENFRTAAKDLKSAMEAISLNDTNLLAIVRVATVASLLVEVTKLVEKIHQAVNELSQQAHFKKNLEPHVSPEKSQSQVLHRGTVQPILNIDNAHVTIIVHAMVTYIFHEKITIQIHQKLEKLWKHQLPT